MDISGYLPNMGILMWTAVIGTFLMLIIVFWNLFFKKGDFLVELLEERSDGNIVVLGSNLPCKRIKTKGSIEKWRLITTKIEAFEPKAKDSLLPFLSKRIDKVYLFRDIHGIMHVLKIRVDEKTKELIMSPDYRDPMNFIVTEYDERAKIKEAQSVWKEYQPLFVGIVCLMMVIASVVLIFDNANKKAGSIDAAADLAMKKIDAKVAQYDALLTKAALIVTNQEVLDRTENWTTSSVGG